MAVTLTREFEKALKETGDKAGLTTDELLRRALKLYQLAADADHVVLAKGDSRREVKL